jgi:hypothetical protein
MNLGRAGTEIKPGQKISEEEESSLTIKCAEMENFLFAPAALKDESAMHLPESLQRGRNVFIYANPNLCVSQGKN